MKLKKGDQIIVTLGKDKGKKGKIEAIFPKENAVAVGGVNVFKKHTKPSGEGKKGGIIEINKPISMGKVALICPKCNKPTRVGYEVDGKSKMRVCRKCGGTI